MLKQKVAEHNPDEFAFGMMSSQTLGGIRVKTRGKDNGTEGPLSMDVAKLLKTQDAGYLRTVLGQVRGQLGRLREEAALAGATLPGAQVGKRILFDELDSSDPTRDGEDDVEDLGMEVGLEDGDLDFDMSDDGSEALDSGPDKDDESLSPEERQRRRKQRKNVAVLKRRAEGLSEKEAELTRALQTLDTQRAKMNRTIGGVNKNGVKFKIRERKR